MKLTCMLAVVAAALTLASAAQAAPRHHAKHHPHQARWHDLSLTQRKAVVSHEVRVHRSALHWWLRRRPRFPTSAAGPFHYCRAVGIRAPGEICVHGQKLVKAVHVLGRIEERLAAIARAKMLASFPPHHLLWLCIHGDPAVRHARGGEAGSWSDPNSGGNGHWGGLQMHPGWGYGTSYHASDDSQWTQEWAAERGYADSGYSSVWLNGQWGQTIGPCWGYA